MSLGHLREVRPFKPRLTGGGSKKGKPQDKIPWVLKIVAHGVVVRAVGTSDGVLKDRAWSKYIKLLAFEDQMNRLCKGWKETLPARSSNKSKLLWNRVYKMWYSGTTDRGTDHDPNTRATMSKEHWSKFFAQDHPPLGLLHDRVLRGEVSISDWREYLQYG